MDIDFDTTHIQKETDIQAQLDPTGELQKPLPTYWQQTKNAYNQSKLVDYESSAKNRYNTQVETELSTIDDTDENKDLIKRYKQSKIKFLDEVIRNKYNADDWDYDYENDTINFNNDSGRELETVIPDVYDTLRGFALSKLHPTMDEKTLNNKVLEDTRKQYLEYETQLQKDDFFGNFGSQMAGNMGAYLTDPVGAATIATELLTFKLFNPIAIGTKGAKALASAKETKEMMTDRFMDYSKQQGNEAIIEQVNKRAISNLISLNKKKMVSLAGAETLIGGSSELYQQELSFDFKHSVLPEFGEEEKNQQIGIVALASGMMSFVGGSLSHGMYKNSLIDTETRGQQAVKEVEDMFEDQEAKIDVDAPDEPKQTFKDKEELDAFKKEEEDALDELEQCLLDNGINKDSINTKGDYMKTDASTRNDGGSRYDEGEGSYNKGQISSEDIARARTGHMSRYKDESVPGSYNKQTWREFEVDLERQGFSKEEAKNIIDNVYTMSGKARTQALKDMGITLD